MTDSKTPLVGLMGFVGTFTLGELKDALGVVVAVLTIAYLIRQHVHFRKPRE